MTSPTIGQTISHYRITAKLGEGGMGAVFRADDLTLGRPVALKFVGEMFASDPQSRRRLLDEARAASRLNHPNIATIYEVSEAEPAPFIAMELVEGESLKSAIERGALPAPRVLEIARQIAEGLREAHAAGVFHRDVKPANVVLDPRRGAKLLDFGIAATTAPQRRRGEDEASFATRTIGTSSTVGTIPYLSPEQARGEPTDARSDIFSFGVLLFECLTGHRPFRGDTPIDILHAILHQATPMPSAHAAGLAPAWDAVVSRCLAKSPADRYGSVGDALEALDALSRVAPTSENADRSIAVLYFENLSGAKDEEYFRDGITEDVITELAKIAGLRVFPRSAVLAYRDKPATAPEIGRALSATHALVGSVRRAGPRLRITVQLIETNSGHSVWAERYDRQMEDVFAIQDEIAQSIARELRVRLTEKEKREIAKAPTRDVQAYDLFLRGRQYFHQLRTKTTGFAREMFARAISIDPTYARAYAGLADCCSMDYMYSAPTKANLEEADAASRKAVELDPELADAHASRGLAESLNKRFENAEKEFQTAIRLDPRLFEAHLFYGRACFAQGRLEDAARLFRAALPLNPAEYSCPSLLGMCLRGLGRLDEAAEANRESLTRAQKHLELHPDDARAVYGCALGWCHLGEREKSLDAARRALAMDPDDSGVLYNIACVYALLGEVDRAIETLRESLHRGFTQKEWIEHDNDFDAIRGDPRFKALLESL